MKIFFYGIILIAIGFLFFQLYRLFMQQRGLQTELTQLIQKTEPVQKDNQKVTDQLRLLKKPEYLDRELRRAGYAAPGEKVFIIVPKSP